MTESTTLEVDADELSDEVVESLVDDGVIDEDEAEEIGDEIWFDEVDVGQPNKTSASQYLGKRFDNAVSIGQEILEFFREDKTVYADITSVEREENGVRIHVDHSRFVSRSFSLSTESETLANLMEYKTVQNPKELEGCKIMINPVSLDSGRCRVLIPHNISASGKLRFKTYSIVSELSEKTLARPVSENPSSLMDSMVSILIVSGVVAFFGFWVHLLFSEIVGSLFVLPLALWSITVTGLLAYACTRGVLGFFKSIFSSDFKEIRL